MQTEMYRHIAQGDTVNNTERISISSVLPPQNINRCRDGAS